MVIKLIICRGKKWLSVVLMCLMVNSAFLTLISNEISAAPIWTPRTAETVSEENNCKNPFIFIDLQGNKHLIWQEEDDIKSLSKDETSDDINDVQTIITGATLLDVHMIDKSSTNVSLFILYHQNGYLQFSILQMYQFIYPFDFSPTLYYLDSTINTSYQITNEGDMYDCYSIYSDDFDNGYIKAPRIYITYSVQEELNEKPHRTLYLQCYYLSDLDAPSEYFGYDVGAIEPKVVTTRQTLEDEFETYGRAEFRYFRVDTERYMGQYLLSWGEEMDTDSVDQDPSPDFQIESKIETTIYITSFIEPDIPEVTETRLKFSFYPNDEPVYSEEGMEYIRDQSLDIDSETSFTSTLFDNSGGIGPIILTPVTIVKSTLLKFDLWAETGRTDVWEVGTRITDFDISYIFNPGGGFCAVLVLSEYDARSYSGPDFSVSDTDSHINASQFHITSEYLYLPLHRPLYYRDKTMLPEFAPEFINEEEGTFNIPDMDLIFRNVPRFIIHDPLTIEPFNYFINNIPIGWKYSFEEINSYELFETSKLESWITSVSNNFIPGREVDPCDGVEGNWVYYDPKYELWKPQASEDFAPDDDTDDEYWRYIVQSQTVFSLKSKDDPRTVQSELTDDIYHETGCNYDSLRYYDPESPSDPYDLPLYVQEYLEPKFQTSHLNIVYVFEGTNYLKAGYDPYCIYSHYHYKIKNNGQAIVISTDHMNKYHVLSTSSISGAYYTNSYGDGDSDGMSDIWEMENDLDPNDHFDAELDYDGDGLINLLEFRLTIDPNNLDSDNDGLFDGYSMFRQNVGSNWEKYNPDIHVIENDEQFRFGEDLNCNGLINGDHIKRNRRWNFGEVWLETDPSNPDSDRDGFLDGEEDVDLNGLIDGDDNHNGILDFGETWFELNPRNPDSDGDGLIDGKKLRIDGISYAGEDLDLDGTLDDDETDPLLQDTDEDGLWDGIGPWTTVGEDIDLDGDKSDIWSISNPSGTESNPRDFDSDDDGIADGDNYEILVVIKDPQIEDLPDGYEWVYYDHLCKHGLWDLDNDGLINPIDWDNDQDGLPDGLEIGMEEPDHSDTNEFDINIYQQMGSYFIGDSDPTTRTDPNNPDTDSDGLYDGFYDINGDHGFDISIEEIDNDGTFDMMYEDLDYDLFLDTDEDLDGDGLFNVIIDGIWYEIDDTDGSGIIDFNDLDEVEDIIVHGDNDGDYLQSDGDDIGTDDDLMDILFDGKHFKIDSYGNWYYCPNEDIDYDGRFDIKFEYDIDHDGITESLNEDIDGDGHFDRGEDVDGDNKLDWSEDLDKDGLFDTTYVVNGKTIEVDYYYDTNGNGFLDIFDNPLPLPDGDLRNEDNDNDGHFDIDEDLNSNGLFDIFNEDIDKDRRFDIDEDKDQDGVFDTYSYSRWHGHRVERDYALDTNGDGFITTADSPMSQPDGDKNHEDRDGDRNFDRNEDIDNDGHFDTGEDSDRDHYLDSPEDMAEGSDDPDGFFDLVFMNGAHFEIRKDTDSDGKLELSDHWYPSYGDVHEDAGSQDGILNEGEDQDHDGYFDIHVDSSEKLHIEVVEDLNGDNKYRIDDDYWLPCYESASQKRIDQEDEPETANGFNDIDKDGRRDLWIDISSGIHYEIREDTDGDGFLDVDDEWISCILGNDVHEDIEDFDGDGIPDGDGKLDMINEDIDGDGYLDLNEDLDGDGNFDNGEDTDGDGHLDIGEDLNADGKFSFYYEDPDPDYANLNGFYIAEDLNHDQFIDTNIDSDEIVGGRSDTGLNEDLDGDCYFDRSEDLDGDGIQDIPEIRGEDLNYNGKFDSDFSDKESDPLDSDSDDDGLLDGDEREMFHDFDNDYIINALDPDSDNDGVQDGTECGLTHIDVDYDRYDANELYPEFKYKKTNYHKFVPDRDSGMTTTDPHCIDTDGDGLSDGQKLGYLISDDKWEVYQDGTDYEYVIAGEDIDDDLDDDILCSDGAIAGDLNLNGIWDQFVSEDKDGNLRLDLAEDLNNDGRLNLHGDLDFDGVLDTWDAVNGERDYIDTNGDGFVNIGTPENPGDTPITPDGDQFNEPNNPEYGLDTGEDRNLNGVLDFGEDVDNDGNLDVNEDTIIENGELDEGEDIDGDGNLDIEEDGLQIDFDGDGNYEIDYSGGIEGEIDGNEDIDKDGVLDLTEDLDEDGYFDYYDGTTWWEIKTNTNEIQGLDTADDKTMILNEDDGDGEFDPDIDDLDGDGYFDFFDINGMHYEIREDTDGSGYFEIASDHCVMCPNEDIDMDGLFDIGEDLNNNGILDRSEDLDSNDEFNTIEDLLGDNDGNFDFYIESQGGVWVYTNEDSDRDGLFDIDANQYSQPTGEEVDEDINMNEKFDIGACEDWHETSPVRIDTDGDRLVDGFTDYDRDRKFLNQYEDLDNDNNFDTGEDRDHDGHDDLFNEDDVAYGGDGDGFFDFRCEDGFHWEVQVDTNENGYLDLEDDWVGPSIQDIDENDGDGLSDSDDDGDGRLDTGEDLNGDGVITRTEDIIDPDDDEFTYYDVIRGYYFQITNDNNFNGILDSDDILVNEDGTLNQPFIYYDVVDQKWYDVYSDDLGNCNGYYDIGDAPGGAHDLDNSEPFNEDLDGDGRFDTVDEDDDEDGFFDLGESGEDLDLDGIHTNLAGAIEGDDGDAILEVTEVWETDPLDYDTDNDGLCDGDEILGWTIAVNKEIREIQSSPFTSDSDGDGFDDLAEYDGKSDPNIVDTDGDGISDEDEICGYYEIDGDPISITITTWQEETGLEKIGGGTANTITLPISSTDRLFTDSYSMDSDGDGLTDGLDLDYTNSDTEFYPNTNPHGTSTDEPETLLVYIGELSEHDPSLKAYYCYVDFDDNGNGVFDIFDDRHEQDLTEQSNIYKKEKFNQVGYQIQNDDNNDRFEFVIYEMDGSYSGYDSNGDGSIDDEDSDGNGFEFIITNDEGEKGFIVTDDRNGNGFLDIYDYKSDGTHDEQSSSPYDDEDDNSDGICQAEGGITITFGQTNPLHHDTDGDGLGDYLELVNYQTNPLDCRSPEIKSTYEVNDWFYSGISEEARFEKTISLNLLDLKMDTGRHELGFSTPNIGGFYAKASVYGQAGGHLKVGIKLRLIISVEYNTNHESWYNPNNVDLSADGDSTFSYLTRVDPELAVSVKLVAEPIFDVGININVGGHFEAGAKISIPFIGSKTFKGSWDPSINVDWSFDLSDYIDEITLFEWKNIPFSKTIGLLYSTPKFGLGLDIPVSTISGNFANIVKGYFKFGLEAGAWAQFQVWGEIEETLKVLIEREISGVPTKISTDFEKEIEYREPNEIHETVIDPSSIILSDDSSVQSGDKLIIQEDEFSYQLEPGIAYGYVFDPVVALGFEVNGPTIDLYFTKLNLDFKWDWKDPWPRYEDDFWHSFGEYSLIEFDGEVERKSTVYSGGVGGIPVSFDGDILDNYHIDKTLSSDLGTGIKDLVTCNLDMGAKLPLNFNSMFYPNYADLGNGHYLFSLILDGENPPSEDSEDKTFESNFNFKADLRINVPSIKIPIINQEIGDFSILLFEIDETISKMQFDKKYKIYEEQFHIHAFTLIVKVTMQVVTKYSFMQNIASTPGEWETNPFIILVCDFKLRMSKGGFFEMHLGQIKAELLLQGKGVINADLSSYMLEDDVVVSAPAIFVDDPSWDSPGGHWTTDVYWAGDSEDANKPFYIKVENIQYHIESLDLVLRVSGWLDYQVGSLEMSKDFKICDLTDLEVEGVPLVDLADIDGTVENGDSDEYFNYWLGG